MDAVLSLSLVTIGGKIHSSNADTSISELCSLTIQPFLNWSWCLQNILPSLSMQTLYDTGPVTSTISPESHISESL